MVRSLYNAKVPQPKRGRPRAFDRDRALLDAARLFWRRGYSGTSTRDLTARLGLSTSSLYGAFGSKAELFEEAVRTYAERYREIYQQAVAASDFRTVVERVLIDSVHEFTRPDDEHPGCLLSSAAMADSTSTLDTSAYFAEAPGLQRADPAHPRGTRRSGRGTAHRHGRGGSDGAGPGRLARAFGAGQPRHGPRGPARDGTARPRADLRTRNAVRLIARRPRRTGGPRVPHPGERPAPGQRGLNGVVRVSGKAIDVHVRVTKDHRVTTSEQPSPTPDRSAPSP